VGAGLDARSFSLPWPRGTRLFELDLPGVITMKSRLLPATMSPCELFYVPCDLSQPTWAQLLRQAGFHPQRTLWLCEGVAMYLQRAAVEAMLSGMRALSTEGSHLLLHAMPTPPPDEAAEAHVSYEFTATPAECSALLHETGWTPQRTITYASALADVQVGPLLMPTAQGLCQALCSASSICDDVTSPFAPYFIPACLP
jgi:methyltransferase (TIGR00027 family)